MCESSAFVLDKNNELKKVMDYIVHIEPYKDKLRLTDLFGSHKIIDGSVKEIKLMDHKIILELNEK